LAVWSPEDVFIALKIILLPDSLFMISSLVIWKWSWMFSDSILSIISDTYSTADAYLKENGRGCTATLIIVGGWIEALYIATQIVKGDSASQNILEKIAEQKFSLTNLIELSKTYKEDDDIKDLIPELEILNEKFESIEITYSKGEVITDTINKITTLKSQVTIDVTQEIVSEIGIIVERIRTSIIQ
jgi:coenzyme F420-reducing hydrogenase delta subunit